MPEYLSPGVYVEEVEIGAKPIEGVSTSTTAFIGGALRGPVLEPTLVTSWSQFEATFGELSSSPRLYLGYAVDAFFRNGGKRAYIVRVTSDDAAKAGYMVKHSETPPGSDFFNVEALDVGADGNSIQITTEANSISGLVNVFKGKVDVAGIAGQDITVSGTSEVIGSFAVGDKVLVEDSTASTSAAVVIQAVSENVFSVIGDFSAIGDPAVNTVTLRAADIAANTDRIRLTNTSDFFPGSIIALSDGAAVPTVSHGVVEEIDGKKLKLKAALNNTLISLDTSDQPTVSSKEFDITFSTSSTSESFTQLAVYPQHPRFFTRFIQSQLVSVTPVDPPPTPAAVEEQLPETLDSKPLEGGVDDNHINHTYTDGLGPLTKVEGISLLAIPGQTDLATQVAMIDHCEFMRYRFAILDSERGQDPTGVKTQKAGLGTKEGFAALYYPWLQAVDPESGQLICLPPSGAVAGIYARTDASRGVHKAPANEKVSGVIGLERTVTKGEQEVLNPDGINVIRFFSGKGNLVWGARTLASNSLWKYVNVRRLFLNLEESIERATHWVVFEPNDEKLWARVRQTVTQYLTSVWKSGALMGPTPGEAFFVKCDRTTMTQSDIDNGRLIVLIGAAPVKPAEFVIFRIAQWQGGSAATE